MLRDHTPVSGDGDEPAILADLLGTLAELAERVPVVFPVHRPRTVARIVAAGLDPVLARTPILRLAPVGYLTMQGLMRPARLVLTNSGGIQKEPTALGIPLPDSAPDHIMA